MDSGSGKNSFKMSYLQIAPVSQSQMPIFRRVEDQTLRGRIKFRGYDEPDCSHEFVRFKIDDTAIDYNETLTRKVVEAYKFLGEKTGLFISMNGGNKRMKLSKQQEISFKQGLVDVMKRDKTVIITGGLNVGVDKLVTETVKEFRSIHFKKGSQVTLIGIASWGVILNRETILSSTQFYGSESIYNNPITSNCGKGKVALNNNCDYFIFWDNDSDGIYDVEFKFRLEFDKYIQSKENNIVVQLLFEGGFRAFNRVFESLRNKISTVVFNHSGRVSNMISEIFEQDQHTFDSNLSEISKKYLKALFITKKKELEFVANLREMYSLYREQIFIFDMHQSDTKFGKKILEAVISGQIKLTFEKRLELTIKFNCADIAAVCLESNYSKIDSKFINDCFIKILKDDKYEFVQFFLDNGIEFENIITEDVLKNLYEKLTYETKLPYHQLYDDENAKNSTKSKDFIYISGKIISTLSGNILTKFYKKQRNEYESSKNRYGAQDLFLWALLGCRVKLANIFWKIGKCQVSSALMASIILNNIATKTNKQGDSVLHKELIEEAERFEDLACKILTKASSEQMNKTCDVLIRKLSNWNELTCLEIAISGKLLTFLSHNVCKSYTTEVWMNGLSPFVPTWVIIVNIPIFIFTRRFIMPFIPQKVLRRQIRADEIKKSFQPEESGLLSINPFDSVIKHTVKKPINYWKSLDIFYSAPIVKFYINFACYIAFLVLFAYLNLVELKPRNEIHNFNDIWAESIIYAYFLLFTLEEIRQIYIRKKPGFCNKLAAYFSGSCNLQDTIIIFLFIVSICVRFFLLEKYFMVCRCMYSICFCMFCLRTLQFYFAYEFFGPKVIMIGEMMRDISFFLSIFTLFILSYGTLLQSMRFPNSVLNFSLLHDIFQKPYYQTYGELMLDSIFDDERCTTLNCYVKYTTIFVGFSIYLLLTNILLVNLLIAMFGHTFNKIQEQSGKHWAYIRLQLVEEFYHKPTVFSVMYGSCKAIYHLFRNNSKIKRLNCCNPLIKKLSEEHDSKISIFEQFCLEMSMYEMQRENVYSAKKEFIENKECQINSSFLNESETPETYTENKIDFQIMLKTLTDKLEGIESKLNKCLKISE